MALLRQQFQMQVESQQQQQQQQNMIQQQLMTLMQQQQQQMQLMFSNISKSDKKWTVVRVQNAVLEAFKTWG